MANTKQASRAELRLALASDISTSANKGVASCICPITGIIFEVAVQGLSRLQTTFSFTAPWASKTEALKLIKHQSLSSLPKNILAGLALTLAGPASGGYGLIELQDMAAPEANTVLGLAEHATLCALIRALERLDKIGAASCPHLALPEASASIDYSLKTLTAEISARLPRAAIAEVQALAEQQGITILSRSQRNTLALARAISSKPALAKYEVEFAKSATLAEAREQFRLDRNEAKEIWKSILGQQSILAGGFPLSQNLIATVNRLLRGDTLNDCPDSIRAKVVSAITRIPHPQAQALARLIKETKNPYDALSRNADTLLDDASDLGSAPAAPKRTLAEIIAAKKAARSQAAGIIYSSDARNPDGTPGDF